jgi:hypothetical protein
VSPTEARAAGFRQSILNELVLHSPIAVAAFRPAVPVAGRGHRAPTAVARADL